MQPPPLAAAPSRPLAAVLAGGESRRFGSPKALARVGGERVVDRVLHALRGVPAEPVLIVNRPELFGDLGIPVRPDRVAGAGALAGIHAALCWAEEAGRPGALCVACDLPFLDPALLRRILEIASSEPADAVVPESTGRRGVEPLCAYYRVTCRAAAEEMLARGDRQLLGLLGRIRARRLPLAEVTQLGEPEILFLNVNTPDDHRRAEELARTTRSGVAR
ncbi:MAG TPA: molybdenum cofactor guanylyltransferase [Longimicrobiaceae bacterium]|nr:molybdenum cofactor guanylyltransferase [Longimicrobiaceae bacterium]